MDMSGHYPLYRLFEPPRPEFEQPRQLQWPPDAPSYSPRFSPPQPQIQAEYTLWGEPSFKPDVQRVRSAVFGIQSVRPPYPFPWQTRQWSEEPQPRYSQSPVRFMGHQEPRYSELPSQFPDRQKPRYTEPIQFPNRQEPSVQYPNLQEPSVQYPISQELRYSEPPTQFLEHQERQYPDTPVNFPDCKKPRYSKTLEHIRNHQEPRYSDPLVQFPDHQELHSDPLELTRNGQEHTLYKEPTEQIENNQGPPHSDPLEPMADESLSIAPAKPEPPIVPCQIEEAVGGWDEPELTGLEEPEKRIIERTELFKCPETDCSDYEDFFDILDQGSNSSGSSIEQAKPSLQPAYPSVYPWASRPARVVNNRGRKDMVMQRRLVRALSQPVKFDKGAKMMQRMGWLGGGLGRDSSGIVEPIAPNAAYASARVGLGQDTQKNRKPRQKQRDRCIVRTPSTKINKEIFKTNILLNIQKFVKNDYEVEVYFDTKLTNRERRSIHMLVAAIAGTEDAEELDTVLQQELVNEIHKYNKFNLNTQSDGEGLQRQICVFKSAPDHTYLVTPDDCRPSICEIKEAEEENPFMKSITKHIKKDEGTILKPKPPHLMDKLVEFFIDFCADKGYTEFRFLGPFTEKEMYVINNFLDLINDLSQKRKPVFNCPVELLNSFVMLNYRFHVKPNPGGFASIYKKLFNLKEEFEKQEEDKKMEEEDHNPANVLDGRILYDPKLGYRERAKEDDI